MARQENDILDGAGRPPVRSLGSNSIRFSTAPALGGDGIVVEAVSRGERGARVTIIGLYGHAAFGWEEQDRVRFNLSPGAYRRLAARVDAALAQAMEDGYGNEEDDSIAVCGDGPGYRTERSARGSVVTVAGSCDKLNPNRAVARAMLGLACPHLDVDFPALPALVRICRGHKRRRV